MGKHIQANVKYNSFVNTQGEFILKEKYISPIPTGQPHTNKFTDLHVEHCNCHLKEGLKHAGGNKLTHKTSTNKQTNRPTNDKENKNIIKLNQSTIKTNQRKLNYTGNTNAATLKRQAKTLNMEKALESKIFPVYVETYVSYSPCPGRTSSTLSVENLFHPPLWKTSSTLSLENLFHLHPSPQMQCIGSRSVLHIGHPHQKTSPLQP